METNMRRRLRPKLSHPPAFFDLPPLRTRHGGTRPAFTAIPSRSRQTCRHARSRSRPRRFLWPSPTARASFSNSTTSPSRSRRENSDPYLLRDGRPRKISSSDPVGVMRGSEGGIPDSMIAPLATAPTPSSGSSTSIPRIFSSSILMYCGLRLPPPEHVSANSSAVPDRR